jgi:hypothetical protein
MRTLGIFCLFLLTPLFVGAQDFAGGLIDTGLSIALEPALPQPQSVFKVSLNDYGGSAFGSGISWFYNDIQLTEAQNARNITLQAGEAGSTGVVKAVLDTPNGTKETLVATINPLYLDIILEPQTHVPTFYKGRALPSAESSINATAFLSGETLLTNEYLYTWRLNNTVIQGGPLRGGSRVSFTMPQDSYSTLSLTVTTLGGTTLAKRTIAVPVVAPKLVFYEVNTLYGIVERSLKSPFSLLGNSMTVRAEPYYLDSTVFNAPSIAAWKIDKADVPPSNNPYDITLERVEAGGSANVTFRIQSTTKLLQGTKGTFTMNVL